MPRHRKTLLLSALVVARSPRRSLSLLLAFSCTTAKEAAELEAASSVMPVSPCLPPPTAVAQGASCSALGYVGGGAGCGHPAGSWSRRAGE